MRRKTVARKTKMVQMPKDHSQPTLELIQKRRVTPTQAPAVTLKRSQLKEESFGRSSGFLPFFDLICPLINYLKLGPYLISSEDGANSIKLTKR
ncbi:hypothetical protein AXF42_Ash011687 [Apostasia shenzhenica]|uniref:Uncharacterized protein n=1 Tax=Apostasia shenzhenica TaxID=1088818 RepID=A0A2H9ZUR2_9ASPA|nr:hypothetical protein AXF42_Ash011687 [Apostasia shenzhenica]